MKKRQLLRFFLDFMKLGLFTFGGGWSIIAQMQKKYVEKEKLISAEELLDITSVGRSLPGMMIGNVAMLFGSRVGGVLCGIVCVIGLIIPPTIILCVIGSFYTAFRQSLWISAAMEGIRAAIVPIIASAVFGLAKGAFTFPPCFAVLLVTLALYLFFNVNCVYLVIIGGVLGIIISEYYERRRGGVR